MFAPRPERRGSESRSGAESRASNAYSDISNTSITSPALEDRLNDLDRMETANLRDERARQQDQIRQAKKKEDQMVAAMRKKKTEEDRVFLSKSNQEFALFQLSRPNERILVDEYVKGLIRTLQKDETVSPLPEDFSTAEGFTQYRDTMKVPLSVVIAKMLKYRFLVKAEEVKPKQPQITKILFKIVRARGLINKEGRSRDAYCSIQYGDLQKSRKGKNINVFQTDVIKNSLDPKWDQHVKIECSSVDDQVCVQVWDKTKDAFLGEIVILVRDIIKDSKQNGFLSSSFKLKPRGKSSDKYVGGEIFIEASAELPKANKTARSFEAAQRNLDSMGCDSRALFKALMRSCFTLDLYTPTEEKNDELLSPESLSMLKLWSIYWEISQACQICSFLSIIFVKYQEDLVKLEEVLRTFHILYSNMKKKGWFPNSEVIYLLIKTRSLLHVLDEMHAYNRMRIVKYKEIYPKNHPKGMLEQTVLILRMIHRFPLYKEAHPDLPESFRDDLRIVMTESCIAKFQTFKEHTSPFDQADVESVVQGLSKLAEMVVEEIELDVKYYQPSFAQYLIFCLIFVGNWI
jgi:hypothetical protein